MKNVLSTTCLFVLFFNVFAQVEFDKGYFINNHGLKIECLINNKGWLYNPTNFEYQLVLGSEIKEETIDSVAEFGFVNGPKYVRAMVALDRSSDLDHKISHTRQPIFNTEVLFLQQLVDGPASLYAYQESHLKRYFYSTDQDSIQQLVYKSYMLILESVNDPLKTQKVSKENNSFRQQLLKINNFSCGEITPESMSKIKYRKNDLVKIFDQYNRCVDPLWSRPVVREDLFNLNVRVGFQNSTLSINSKYSDIKDVSFGQSFGFRAGIEFETILPLWKKSWSVFCEPTYQRFTKSTTITYLQTSVLSRQTSVTADYHSLELPVGLRYYYQLNSKARWFANVALVFDFPFSNSEIKTEKPGFIELGLNTKPNFAFGLGYCFKEKLFLELRYGFSRNVLAGYATWNAQYTSTSFSIGYHLF